MDVVGLGTFAMDVLMKVDNLPREDAFCIIEETTYLPGGSGTNVISQIAKLGGKCGYIGKIANDTIGKEIIENLEKDQVDTKCMVVKEGGTSLHTNIVVDHGGSKFIMLNMGDVAMTLLPEEVDYQYLANAKVFYTDLFPKDPAIQGLKLAKESGKCTVFNLQTNLETMEGLGISKEDILSSLTYVDVFAPCRDGLFALTGTDDLVACKDFLRKYCKGILVFTLGSNGVVAFDEQDSCFEISSMRVKVVDTTGAGDSFIGAFIHSYYLQNKTLSDALTLASACAAYTCTGLGARYAPTTKELEDFLKQT
jgi:sugar/nucleoside kinase (ribokinase family)